jgi:hypothetical protein
MENDAKWIADIVRQVFETEMQEKAAELVKQLKILYVEMDAVVKELKPVPMISERTKLLAQMAATFSAGVSGCSADFAIKACR